MGDYKNVYEEKKEMMKEQNRTENKNKKQRLL